MADDEHIPGTMDIRVQEKTFAGFVTAVTRTGETFHTPRSPADDEIGFARKFRVCALSRRRLRRHPMLGPLNSLGKIGFVP